MLLLEITYQAGANTRYVTGNNFSNRAGRRTANNLTTKPLINDGTILLPIPSDLKDANSVKYDTSTLNGLQAVGAAAVEGGSEAVSDLVGSFFPGGNENNERQAAVDELGNVAKTAFGDVIGGVGSEAAATNFKKKICITNRWYVWW